MKHVFAARMCKHILYLGLCITVLLTSSRSLASDLEVDWPSYIAKQDLHWKSLPQLWDEALFLGNGQMGSMMFQQDDNHMVIQVGRGDVQEHRQASGIQATGSALPDSSRVPVGYFTLDTVGKLQGCKLRLPKLRFTLRANP